VPREFVFSAHIILLPEVFPGTEIQFFVPVLSELADERFTQKAVYRKVLLCAAPFCAAAYFPAMKVDRQKRPVLRHAHRIKVTGNRLEEINAFFAAGLFDGAAADATGIVTGKNTVFAVNNRGDNLAVPVNVRFPAGE
jgi:hypothetical protein